MSLFIVGGIAGGVAMMANNNEDSPALWGIITFAGGIAGALTFGFLGAILGASLGVGLYVAKMLKFG
ncbi:hypothetical protein [Roseimaritima ulvae]|uniref:Uncharacterized protein n=1 Tax=Roseimaritima ulvae TaxID=980254 RepID=A0A5B9QMG7_9BACT|nr:hypothetical protein [Roseimaritima ulvae]QEG39269.1 hypothetical protein UC8_12300 [Roseimaritima ulvae]